MLYHPVKIGKIELNGNLFLAPVAGYSDRSFRSICIENGASFTYTEMVSAEALTRNNLKTETLMRRAENEKVYSVQIFGGEPEKMAEAAEIVLEKTHCECIDINCGCPVPKIVKTGAGSALTQNPQMLKKVAEAVVNAVKGRAAVTVKIRSGWDQNSITYKEAATAALEAGINAITMHPRTKAQGYEGKSDWAKLSELVKLAEGKVPIFGSGDLFTPEDAKRMLEETGVSGVMFARGAMGNPFIFTKTIQLLTTGSYKEIPVAERLKTGFKELEMLSSDTNEKNACMEMRKRFCAYSKGISGGAELRQKTVHASSIQEYHTIFDPYIISG
ncbi:MAG: tRNA dihydrouridine synthase DusB [Treponema sp.]|jgi:nifR3 family TIM-barrel protein|nr:tRNA dihydrouridine synthase DusB [Treponema sp.]